MKPLPSFEQYLLRKKKRKAIRKMILAFGGVAAILLLFMQCEEEFEESVEEGNIAKEAPRANVQQDRVVLGKKDRPSIGQARPDYSAVESELKQKSAQLIQDLKKCIASDTQAKLDWSFLYNAATNQVSKHQIELLDGQLFDAERKCILNKVMQLSSMLRKKEKTAQASPTLRLHWTIELL